MRNNFSKLRKIGVNLLVPNKRCSEHNVIRKRVRDARSETERGELGNLCAGGVSFFQIHVSVLSC